MAATYLDITLFTRTTIAGVQLQFRLTARNAVGTVDAGYVGTVTFTSDDPTADLPAPYTFVGGDAGTRLFRARMRSVGARTVTADDGSIVKATARTQVLPRPPGWGFDDEGLLPLGDAAASIGANLVSATAISTREVEVTVSNLVQDNSAFLVGDALNPATWVVQRLDNAAFLHVVSVRQSGTYSYVLLCLEEFGPVTVTHEASTSTLLDLSGNVINTPHFADFLGITDEDKTTLDAQMAKRRVGAVDIANPQVPQSVYAAGSLQLDAAGDYVLETGPQLLKKLILRRLMTTPGDFFHLPGYGVGIRQKEPLPLADMGRLRTLIEQQVQREPEAEAVQASLTLDSKGVLTVTVRAKSKSTGESIEVGFTPSNTGVQP